MIGPVIHYYTVIKMGLTMFKIKAYLANTDTLRNKTKIIPGAWKMAEIIEIRV